MSFNIPIADQMRIALSYVKFKAREKRLRTDEKVIADTVYGRVKGEKWESVYGSTYYSFEGIPFAKPPVGELRFRAPEEPEPWQNVRRCTRVRSKPCQMNILMKQVQGKEDCLYLNVYTRWFEPTKPLPVMVWIYGGGFQMGEASRELYSPDYFMLEQVMLVTISYRLGALGFLSLRDPELEVPGNAGLKDQVLALKWVKRNCRFFGGDPDNITVFGESAGGGSTHYMMMTEQARGLFHKGVVMSGSALAPWANIPQNNWAYRLAKATGYLGEDNDRDVLGFLRQRRATTLFKVTEQLLTLEERHQRLTFCFGPTVEPYVGENCVIPRAPIEMMRSCWGNEIPLLIGGNSFEGLLMFSEVRKYPELLTELGDCEYLTPRDACLSAEKRKEFGKMIKEAYFGDQEPSIATIMMYSDIFSYKYFWHGIHRTVLSRVHHAAAPTYLYRFDFDSKHFNFMRIINCGRKVRGTCHADDLAYIFYNAVAKKLKHRSAEYRTIRRLTAILVQFAACGNPNIPLRASTPRSSSGATCSTSATQMTADRGDGCSSVVADATAKNGAAAARATEDAKSRSGAAVKDDAAGNDNAASKDDTAPQDVAAVKDDADVQNVAATRAARSQADAWLPVSKDDKVFRCLNISNELEVIDLPEADKLRLWDRMYEHNRDLLYGECFTDAM